MFFDYCKDLGSESMESYLDSKSVPIVNEQISPHSSSSSSTLIKKPGEKSVNTTSRDSLSASLSPLSSSSNNSDLPENMSSLSSNSEISEVLFLK